MKATILTIILLVMLTSAGSWGGFGDRAVLRANDAGGERLNRISSSIIDHSRVFDGHIAGYPGRSEPACVPAPANMIGWWPGENNANDIQGGNNGMLVNGVTFAPGKVGQAFALNGSSQFVNVPDSPSLNVGTDDFSVDFWVRFNSLAGEQVLVEKYIETLDCSKTGWTITKLSGNVLLFAAVCGSDNSGFHTITSTDTWYFVAMRRSNGVVTTFLDGVASPSMAASGNLNSTSSLKFGHRGNPIDTPGSTDTRQFFLNGSIDEVEIFSRALSDAEIQAIFAAGGFGKCKCSGISCPANVTQSNDNGQCGGVVNYAAPTASGSGCGTITCSPASGSFFPVGTTTVNCSSTSGASCSFSVTVSDTEAPMLACSDNISTSADSGLCSALIKYQPPFVTDNCPCSPPNKQAAGPTGDSSCPSTCNPAPGTTFPKGSTTVTCTANDLSNNMSMCSFTVTVNDTQAPNISCPANIVHGTDPNVCQAVVTYLPPVVSDNCPGVGVPTCSPASGTTFPKGSTTITCSVMDSSNNMSICSFTVIVNDTQPPVFPNGCPAGITSAAQAMCPFTAASIVNYTKPAATDNCPPVPTVACNPPPGSMFPRGTTMVTCTAADNSGNTATCAFPVTVYSVCLQDDSNSGNVVFVNAVTGDYLFCSNGVPVPSASGTGTLVVHGCNFQVDHTKGDRKVHIQGDTAANSGVGSGTAYIQKQGGGFVVQITDRNMSNDSCTCSSAPRPPAPSK